MYFTLKIHPEHCKKNELMKCQLNDGDKLLGGGWAECILTLFKYPIALTLYTVFIISIIRNGLKENVPRFF